MSCHLSPVATAAGYVRFDEATAARLRRQLRDVGMESAARDAGVNRHTLSRAGCGLEIQRGSAAMILSWLEEVAA